MRVPPAHQWRAGHRLIEQARACLGILGADDEHVVDLVGPLRDAQGGDESQRAYHNQVAVDTPLCHRAGHHRYGYDPTVGRWLRRGC